MLHHYRIDLRGKLMLLKLLTVKNVSFVTIAFLIMGFKIWFVIIVMIWRYCVSVILLLSLLEKLTITVLFMTLANLTQIICQKILCFIVGICKIKIKNRVYNHYFDNLTKVKKKKNRN